MLKIKKQQNQSLIKIVKEFLNFKLKINPSKFHKKLVKIKLKKFPLKKLKKKSPLNLIVINNLWIIILISPLKNHNKTLRNI
jgi:hypothetical protein